MSAAVRLLTPDAPDPRDWKVKVGDDEAWEVRVEIVSECVYVGLYDDGSDSSSNHRTFQLELSEARRVAEKILAACDLMKDVPSRPFG